MLKKLKYWKEKKEEKNLIKLGRKYICAANRNIGDKQKSDNNYSQKFRYFKLYYCTKIITIIKNLFFVNFFRMN